MIDVPVPVPRLLKANPDELGHLSLSEYPVILLCVAVVADPSESTERVASEQRKVTPRQQVLTDSRGFTALVMLVMLPSSFVTFDDVQKFRAF